MRYGRRGAKDSLYPSLLARKQRTETVGWLDHNLVTRAGGIPEHDRVVVLG